MSASDPTIARTRKPMSVTWNRIFDWDRAGWRSQAACQHTELGLFFPTGSTGLAVTEILAAVTSGDVVYDHHHINLVIVF
jgi:hypothetical protein